MLFNIGPVREDKNINIFILSYFLHLFVHPVNLLYPFLIASLAFASYLFSISDFQYLGVVLPSLYSSI